MGRIERRTTDPSRPTTPRPQWADRAAPDRTLPYVVLYPAAGEPEPGEPEPGEPTAGEPDAPPSDDGPFPVVMWSHGMGSHGGERNDVLARWASAGYVVVAPTFPLSSRASDASDLPNQPLDVAFVLDQVRAANADPADPLHGLVRADCVALAGHSMGGGTTLAATFDPRTASIAPEAFVDVAGLMPDEAGGVSLDQAPPVPALVVHGGLDATVPMRVGQELVGRLHAPTWFLTFPAGDHNNLFVAPQVELLDTTVTAFLDAQLKGSPGRLDALAASVDASGMATLEALPAR